MKEKKALFLSIGAVIVIIIVIIGFGLTRGKKTQTPVVNVEEKENTLNTAEEIYNNYASIVYGQGQELERSEITAGGTYNISGEHKCLHILSKDDVQINLYNAVITCNTGPAIYVEDADSVDITLAGENKVTAKTTAELNGTIYSTDDLIIEGPGSLLVESNYDGIVSKDALVISGGTYKIITDDDAIRGKDEVAIVDGNFTITAKGDGIKATNAEGKMGFVVIDNGKINIDSGNDAIQAETYLNINGGEITATTAKGSGTTIGSGISAKGLKAGKQVVIHNGTITLNTAEDSIHSSGSVFVDGGTTIIQSSDDALHADQLIRITNGTLEITKSREGLEGPKIEVQGGTANIIANDDGLNGTTDDNTNPGTINISGGTLTIYSAGDGIDCNGNIEITGGTIYVESTSESSETALDHDGTLKVSGGTIMAVAKSAGPNDIGTKESTIPMLVAAASGTGPISLGTISYTPTMDRYKYIIIASPTLEAGALTFTYGEKSEEVTLTNSVTTIGNSGSHSGGRTRGENSSRRPSGESRGGTQNTEGGER